MVRRRGCALPKPDLISSTTSGTPSKSSLSLISASTNHILTECARLSNKTHFISATAGKRSQKVPHEIIVSSRRLRKHYRQLKHLKFNANTDLSEITQMMKQYSLHRSKHRKLVRSVHAKKAISRDTYLLQNPGATFAHIRSSKRANAGKIHKLNVGSTTFCGKNVQDGFFMSVKQLKTRNNLELEKSTVFKDISLDYQRIIKLSKESKGPKAILIEIKRSKIAFKLYKMNWTQISISKFYIKPGRLPLRGVEQPK